ncbi:MAG: aminotransferase class III-fold pyridoxal phosphate-dependent enzyme [Bacteriovoracaceae bacterium]|nr:aminotransferase class III-fold pyridoxal phosphate-dependent enzyme [Bacteriovoracaceae bacterium]
MEITLINNEDQKYAEGKLAKYYKDGLIPAEKKNYLTELNNNHGPYMGVETGLNQTHYLMDAASQIATLGLGFSPSVFMGTAHHMASWTNDLAEENFLKIKNSMHSFLMRKAGWKHMDMTVCNSGAESNEIALGYAFKRRQNKKAKKVLAFEGSFHGRMLVSLFSTWNKSKREPFQWKGFETEYTDFPELPGAEIHQDYPNLWREVWDNSTSLSFKIPNDWPKDEVLQTEIDCLLKIKNKLQTGEIFSIIVEPMQCEGGDRYASDRFHTALLIMAKSFNVSVIHDEVQTGFHLGRDFFWHRQFCLRDQFDNQLNPDFLVCAKKAQVGLVLSPHDLRRDKLERREQYQVASLIRGYYHGLALDQSKERILKIEKYSQKKLKELANNFEKNITRTRAMGLSFAFDLENADTATKFINERFNNGLLYYPAGEKTLRFRLNTSYTNKDIDFLFERLTAIGNLIFNAKEESFSGKVTTSARSLKKTESWQHLLLQSRLDRLKGKMLKEDEVLSNIQKQFNDHYKSDQKLIIINAKNFDQYSVDIEKMQKEVYEPTRQTSIERFRVCAHSEYSICLGMLDGEKLSAIAFSSSLQDHPLDRGLRQDKDFLDPKSLYMIDTTVRDQHQNLGLGRFLKYALTYIAINRDYNSIKGRNRDKLAVQMLNINLSIGSYEQMYLREDYPDFEQYRDVIYYETPLDWKKDELNLGNRINSSINIDDIDMEYIKAQLPYLTNKVCLSNFVSEKFLSHVENILKLAPKELQHGYTASGQSECVDKVFKSMIYNATQFKEESKLLTFKGHYFGSGSFLSRSLSGSEEHNYFPTIKLENPTQENSKDILKEISTLIERGEINSIWLEPVQQTTYQKSPIDFLKQLKALANDQNIPVIYNETASQQFTFSNDHYFASNDSSIMPNASFSFLGGQAGIIFIEESLFVSKPLMMISTWDGDEHAFATYHKASSKIISNKEDFLKTRNDFQQKITTELKNYPAICHNIENGRGLINGAIPLKFRKLFRETEDGLLLDPCYNSMKSYLR